VSGDRRVDFPSGRAFLRLVDNRIPYHKGADGTRRLPEFSGPTKSFWFAFSLDIAGVALISVFAGIWRERARPLLWPGLLFILAAFAWRF
jgi:hypothetical protein